MSFDESIHYLRKKSKLNKLDESNSLKKRAINILSSDVEEGLKKSLEDKFKDIKEQDYSTFDDRFNHFVKVTDFDNK